MSDGIEIRGSKELLQAVNRNPKVVAREVKDFFARAMNLYKIQIWRNPWRMGETSGSGKGAPVDSGFLRRSHQTEIKSFEAKIYPRALYAGYVHKGTNQMQARPWLDQAKKDQSKPVNKLLSTLLDKIVKDLAK